MYEATIHNTFDQNLQIRVLEPSNKNTFLADMSAKGRGIMFVMAWGSGGGDKGLSGHTRQECIFLGRLPLMNGT